MEILRILGTQVKIHQIRVIFETRNQSFSEFCITLQCHETYILYTFLVEILYKRTNIKAQSTNLVKLHVSSQKSKILQLDGFLLCKSYKISAKKVQKSYLS